MSETGDNRSENIRQTLIERSAQDEDFRKKLLADPKGTVEEELGASLPVGVEVRAVEETPETIYPVLPPRAAIREGGELSEKELEAVAGGWEGSGERGTETGYSTVTCSGAACRAGNG